jgi:hypothetical protein
MAGNIGGLYRRYGDDSTIFRVVNIGGEKEYRIREIAVYLDGHDELVFDKYINHVTFSFQKLHGSGEVTSGEVTINRRNFESGQLPLQRLTYRWDDESNTEQWMKYKYKTDWSFVGGVRHSGSWIETENAAINLNPPYRHHQVEFISSPEKLKEGDVRLVSIRVKQDFFGREITESFNLLPDRNEFTAQRTFAMPPGNDSIEYVITWTLNNRKKITSGILTSSESVIFCDELPPPI